MEDNASTNRSSSRELLDEGGEITYDDEKKNQMLFKSIEQDPNCRKQQLADSFMNQNNTLERSLLASKDHVFLSWHDIRFTVPVRNSDRNGIPLDAIDL